MVSSGHPRVVVSTAHVDDCDESSSFLMERLLQALPLSRMDLMSAEKGCLRGCSQATPGQDSQTILEQKKKKNLLSDTVWQGVIRL